MDQMFIQEPILLSREEQKWKSKERFIDLLLFMRTAFINLLTLLVIF